MIRDKRKAAGGLLATVGFMMTLLLATAFGGGVFVLVAVVILATVLSTARS